MILVVMIGLGSGLLYLLFKVEHLQKLVEGNEKLLSALIWTVVQGKKLITMDDMRESIDIGLGKKLPREDTFHYNEVTNKYSDDYIDIFGEKMKGVRESIIFQNRNKS